ncbi:MAG: hypothetical protein IIC58_01395 [Proteobacteria bacterium]|nr:hypothetical protein [Pseudomonadota bacterium]
MAGWISQALDEVEELRAAIVYDEEFMDEASTLVEPLSAGLSELLRSFRSIFQTGHDNLTDYLRAFLRNTDQRVLPFWPVIKLIPGINHLDYITDS